MDFEVAAKNLLLAILNDSRKDIRETARLFSNGEQKMMGLLFLVNDGMSAGELSEKMNVSTARIAKILNTLENKGSVRRQPDEKDRRIVLVYLTEQGRADVSEKYDRYLGWMMELLSRVGEEDAQEYLRIVRKIRQIAVEINEQQRAQEDGQHSELKARPL